MMHPADSATLVSAFALATSGINDEVRVRMRDGQGAVQTVSAAATLLDAGDRPHFELSLTTEAARGALLPELSDRQWEVVSRLNRGERVVTIATAMYLSQSTIRNHLSAIFEKVGVHSQRELLDALRPDQHVSLERRTRASARSFGT